MPLAHIAGIPVEESLLTVAPAAVTLAGVALRGRVRALGARLRRLRRAPATPRRRRA